MAFERKLHCKSNQLNALRWDFISKLAGKQVIMPSYIEKIKFLVYANKSTTPFPQVCGYKVCFKDFVDRLVVRTFRTEENSLSSSLSWRPYFIFPLKTAI